MGSNQIEGKKLNVCMKLHGGCSIGWQRSSIGGYMRSAEHAATGMRDS